MGTLCGNVSCLAVSYRKSFNENVDFPIISLKEFFHDFYKSNVELVIDNIEKGCSLFPKEQLLDFVCNKLVQCKFANPIKPREDNRNLVFSDDDQLRIQELNRAFAVRLPKCPKNENQIQLNSLVGVFQVTENQVITIIKTARQLSSFWKMPLDYQILVLKSRIKELYLLWNIFSYDHNINCFVYVGITL